MLFVILLLAARISCSYAFSPISTKSIIKPNFISTHLTPVDFLTSDISSSSLDSSVLISLLQKAEKAQAQGEFYFFFFGGSGALGIGFAQLPKLIQSYKLVQSLAEDTNSLGGADLECNPIATIGFPVKLKVDDVVSIIRNMPTVDAIKSKGRNKSYMEQLGYLERQAFYETYENKANKLALYAIYEAISGGGGDLASPVTYEQFKNDWQNIDVNNKVANVDLSSVDRFTSALLLANSKRYAAYGVFFFLIALVLDLIIESGINAFL
eukprot:gene9627-12963_t